MSKEKKCRNYYHLSEALRRLDDVIDYHVARASVKSSKATERTRHKAIAYRLRMSRNNVVKAFLNYGITGVIDYVESEMAA